MLSARIGVVMVAAPDEREHLQFFRTYKLYLHVGEKKKKQTTKQNTNKQKTHIQEHNFIHRGITEELTAVQGFLQTVQ